MVKNSYHWVIAWLAALVLHLTLFLGINKAPEVKIAPRPFSVISLKRLPPVTQSSGDLPVNNAKIIQKTTSFTKQPVGVTSPIASVANKPLKVGKKIEEEKQIKTPYLPKENKITGSTIPSNPTGLSINGESLRLGNKHIASNASEIGGAAYEGDYQEQQIIKAIMQHWIKPTNLSNKDFSIWRVELSLEGRILKLVLEESSGNGALDLSAQEAIYAAQPFSLAKNLFSGQNFLELKLIFKDN